MTILARHLWPVATLFVALPAMADPAIISRTIANVDRGRTPVAGAKVTIRTFADGRLTQEAVAVANAQGTVSEAVAPLASPGMGSDAEDEGYVMIEAPDGRVGFDFDLSKWETGQLEPSNLPYGLTEGTTFSGVVQDPDHHPVAGAIVAITGFERSESVVPVNDPSFGVKTPSLVQVTGADGRFKFPPVTLGDVPGGFGKTEITATATTNGRVWDGYADSIGLATFPPAGQATANIDLHPTFSLHGTTVNDASGQPVGGVAVRLKGFPPGLFATVPPVVTDALGRFDFPEVPIGDANFLVHSAGFLPEKVEAPNPASPDADATGPSPDSVTIKLNPLVPFRGKVLDAATGKPPLLPVDVMATFDDNTQPPDDSDSLQTSATTAADGSFTMSVPSGDIAVTLEDMPSRYAIAAPTTLTVGENGLTGAVIKVQKAPGLLCEFVNLPQADCEVQFRDASGRLAGRIWLHPTQFFTARNWGDPIEFQVVERKFGAATVLLPWTKFTADAAQWPKMITLPTLADIPTFDVRGRFLDDTGRPINGARIAIYQEPVNANLDPKIVYTGPDGNFDVDGLAQGVTLDYQALKEGLGCTWGQLAFIQPQKASPGQSRILVAQPILMPKRIHATLSLRDDQGNPVLLAEGGKQELHFDGRPSMGGVVTSPDLLYRDVNSVVLTPDASGNLTADLLPGPYRPWVELPYGYGTWGRPVEFSAANPVQTVTITRIPGRLVRFTSADPTQQVVQVVVHYQGMFGDVTLRVSGNTICLPPGKELETHIRGLDSNHKEILPDTIINPDPSLFPMMIPIPAATK